MDWLPHPSGPGHTVVGDVRVLRGVESPQLGNRRDLFVYVPRSHGSGRRFPVLYMHDGNNLFDEPTSHAGEWRVDETMEELADEGLEAIVVGVPHGADRGGEYAGASADAYLSFLVDTVRPLVEQAFDVDSRPESTGLAGSSLGAVISLHGLYARPDVFGRAGAFSPAFWWNGDRMFDVVERTPPPPARIYMDVGDREDDDDVRRRAYVDGFERMAALLRRKGYDDATLLAVLARGGLHHEGEWARRLPDALRFLLR
jgi:predicted alpha/beta superfamily hydrolase